MILTEYSAEFFFLKRIVIYFLWLLQTNIFHKCNEIVGDDVNDIFKCNEADTCVFSSFLNATSMLLLLLLLIIIQSRRQCASFSITSRILMARCSV